MKGQYFRTERHIYISSAWQVVTLAKVRTFENCYFRFILPPWKPEQFLCEIKFGGWLSQGHSQLLRACLLTVTQISALSVRAEPGFSLLENETAAKRAALPLNESIHMRPVIFYYTCQHHSWSQFPLTPAANTCLKWGTHLPHHLSSSRAFTSLGTTWYHQFCHYYSKRFTLRCRREKVKILISE